MYPASKEMDPSTSGTGVFYQAMPAVGADGKNIMKLIPVQMINGQFVPTQISKPLTHPTPPKAVNLNMASASVQTGRKAALNPPASQQVSLLNVLPNQVGLDLRTSLNKRPMAKVPPMASPPTNSEKSVRMSGQLPVTVKSPALPRGQYLQIPPHAQVRMVPVTELPPNIKKQIFNSASFSPSSAIPSVVYVSPVTTINQGAGLQNDSALRSRLKRLPRASNMAACGPPSKGSKRHLKLIPKTSQRPNSPIKWMIEEEDSSPTAALAPLDVSSPAEILMAMAKRRNAIQHCDVTTKSGQERENALLMCNGKVFFLAKKCSLPHRTGNSDSPAPLKDGEFSKSTVASSQQSPPSVAPEMRQGIRITIPDESDEVIDLCGDDDDDDSSAATHLDEDNVIFVSYIPPKSESGSEPDLLAKTQMASTKGSDHLESSSSDTATEAKSPDGGPGRGGVSPHGGSTAGQSLLVSAVENILNVCGSAVMKMHDTDCSNLSSQRSTSAQPLEGLQEPADPSTSDSSRGEELHNMEALLNPAVESTPSPAPESQLMSDRLLRRMFNITADVRIWLQRIDEASAGQPGRPPGGFHTPQETNRDNGFTRFKPVEVAAEQTLFADPPSQSPHTHTGPHTCSHFKRNTSPLSASKCSSSPSSPTGASCDVAPGSMLGYVQPIDEDFLSTDENDVPDSRDADSPPLTSSCVDLNANIRRVGRTRKRTMCPCCIAGSQAPAVKSGTRTEEAERWTWVAEKTRKKGGRTKALRKAAKAPGGISCLSAKNEQNCSHEVPASDGESTASTDNEELKRHEQMRRLKDPLRDKEAATS